MTLNLRTVGRPAKQVAAHTVRELTEADLGMLALGRPTAQPPAVKQIRDSHHAVARCLAQGMRPGQVSIITGYSLSRISILQADPSFRELLLFYREPVGEAFADLQVRMASLSLDALEILRERMLDSPEDFNPSQLLDIMKAGADRTGHGPSTKNTQVNVNIDLAARLESARRRAGIIDGTLADRGVSTDMGVSREAGEGEDG